MKDGPHPLTTRVTPAEQERGSNGGAMADEIVLRGHPGIGPRVEGEALVSRHGFSARYDLNRKTGLFSRDYWLPGSVIAEAVPEHSVLLNISRADLDSHKTTDEPAAAGHR